MMLGAEPQTYSMQSKSHALPLGYDHIPLCIGIQLFLKDAIKKLNSRGGA